MVFFSKSQVRQSRNYFCYSDQGGASSPVGSPIPCLFRYKFCQEQIWTRSEANSARREKTKDGFLQQKPSAAKPQLFLLQRPRGSQLPPLDPPFLVCFATKFAEMQIGYNIPTSEIRVGEWNKNHYRRMLGNPRLQKILNEVYVSEKLKEVELTLD